MKKYLFPLVCITLLVSAAITPQQGYTDLELQIANNFAKKGIIIDYSKNPELYRLNENITRSELMAIALKIKGVKLPDEFVCQGKYADVVDNNWICRTVELSLDNQLIRSPSADKNTARPLDVVTRAEALAILLKANGLSYAKNVARGSYASSMPQWQIDVMEGAVTLKIIPSTQWRGPNTIIKRKEVLWLAHNMKYATGEYKLSTITTPTWLNTAPEENTEAAKRNITNSAIVVKQDPVEKLKYTFSVAPKTVTWTVKSVNWYIQVINAPDMGDSLWTGMSYTYAFTESGKYTIEAKIEDSFGNILTSRMVAEITVIGAGTTTPPTTTTTPPTTPTTPSPGTTVSGEAALTTPPKVGDKVSVKINNVATSFTVGDSTNTLVEVDEAVRTMKIGDKKNVTISSRTGGKITTNIFVVELIDIQRTAS